MKRITNLLVLCFLAGCAYPFSDFQSARLVKPGQVELTPSYSYVQVRNEGESEKAQDEFGLQAAFGLSDRSELRVRYYFLSPADLRSDGVTSETSSISVLAMGPKFGLLQDRVALGVPLGFAFGSDVDTGESWQLQPTLFATLAESQNAQLTVSAKALFWLNCDCDNLVAFNMGLGLGPDVAHLAIRPEVGVLINPGESGSFWQFGLGLSTALGEGR